VSYRREGFSLGEHRWPS